MVTKIDDKATRTMRAFIIENVDDGNDGKNLKGSLKLHQPVPEPMKGEALVRVLRAGVCNTDLELLAGYMGFTGIVGHEFVGVVQEVMADDEAGDDWGHLLGKRVVGEINLACTKCKVCCNGGDGARNHCPKRTVLGILGKHGTYAEYLTLPCRNLHLVPDNVSDAAAVFAEPLAAACRILEQGLAPPQADAAILGDGKLGLLIAEVLARRKPVGEAGAAKRGRTTLIGRHEEKMALCCTARADSLDGQVPAGNADGHPLLDLVGAGDSSKVTALAGSYDVVVDATGSPQGLASALELCRPLGTVVLKSTCAAGAGFNPAPIVINEQRVVGSRCGPFEAALELLGSLEAGLDVEKYISEVFPLEKAEAAVEAARKRGALKIQIVCSGSAGA